MAENAGDAEASVLQSKREATSYRILIEVAERQPAVNQREIADAIGVTAQAVSEYLRDLIAEGFVTKEGRGRYEITKEGVDWLMDRTSDLESFLAHVTEDVIGEVEVETALAATEIIEGRTVSLSMEAGVLTASADGSGGATAVAVTSAEPGEDVAVTEFEGIVEYEVGSVTIVSLPEVREGGSSVANADRIAEFAEECDLVASAGTEALAAARAAAIEPDIRFGTAPAVEEAATKGLDVLLLATTDVLSRHTDRLREANVNYELLDATEDDR